jgi:hypothetical protein
VIKISEREVVVVVQCNAMIVVVDVENVEGRVEAEYIQQEIQHEQKY